MFREITEVKSEERLNNKKDLGYLKIKPEHDLSNDEIEAFWKHEFELVKGGV